jgi:hypothetical protein
VLDEGTSSEVCMSEIRKLFAASQDRYNGGARVKREHGSSTVTRFLVGVDGSPADTWVRIEGYGKTPGDRKTYALNEYRQRYGSAKDRELSEMEGMLERNGYSPMHAKKLLTEGMGPEELRGRIAQGEQGVGSLHYTHGIGKVLRNANVVRSPSDLPLFPRPVSLPPGTRTG